MRKAVSISIIFLVVLLICSTPVIAQGPGRGMGMGPYDVKTEATVSGTVQAVQKHPGRGGNVGVHLLLKTKDHTLDVHVGPRSYIDKQKLTFAEGDTVEVTGSMVKINDAILARVIKKDGKELKLRDDSGKPLWAGGPPRP